MYFTGSDNYTNGLGVSWVSNAIDTYEAELRAPVGQFWSFLP